MPEQSLEEPSCGCKRDGALFCFINNHMDSNNILLFFFVEYKFFLHSMFMIQYTKKAYEFFLSIARF